MSLRLTHRQPLPMALAMLTWVSGFLYLSPVVPRENSSVPAFEEDLSIASDNLTKVISSDRGLKSMGLIFDEVLSLSFIGTGTGTLY